MYTLVLVLHSILRWAVLPLGVLALARAASGWSGDRPYEQGASRAGLLYMISLDVQLLLGLLLYAVLSPYTSAAFRDFGGAMRNRELRFWAVEHLAMMLLAVVAAHVGRASARRASDDRAKHRRAAVWYGVSLLLILAAIPWPFRSIARPLFRLG